MKTYNVLYLTDSDDDLFNLHSSTLENYAFTKTNLSDNLKALCGKYHPQILIIFEHLFDIIRNNILKEEIELPIIILKQTKRDLPYFNHKNHYVAILKSPFSELELKQVLDNALIQYKLKNENKLLLTEVKRLEDKEFSLLKKEVLNNLSHEIRTPLNAIVGFADLLISKNSIIQENKEYFSIIEESSNRLINYIDNLTEFLRHDKSNNNLSFTYISPYEMLQSIVSIFQITASRKNIIIKTGTIQPELQKLKIKTDKHKIITIFSKFINSAIYHADNGTIQLGLSKNQDGFIFLEYTEEFSTQINHTLLDSMLNSKENQKNTLNNELIEIILIKRNLKQLKARYWFQKEKRVTTIKIELPHSPIFSIVNTKIFRQSG